MDKSTYSERPRQAAHLAALWASTSSYLGQEARLAAGVQCVLVQVCRSALGAELPYESSLAMEGRIVPGMDLVLVGEDDFSIPYKHCPERLVACSTARFDSSMACLMKSSSHTSVPPGFFDRSNSIMHAGKKASGSHHSREYRPGAFRAVEVGLKSIGLDVLATGPAELG